MTTSNPGPFGGKRIQQIPPTLSLVWGREYEPQPVHMSTPDFGNWHHWGSVEEMSHSGSVGITSRCHLLCFPRQKCASDQQRRGYFQTSVHDKGAPIIPEVHFDIFIVVEKGLHKSYSVSLTLAPLGPEQTWLAFITLRLQPPMGWAGHGPLAILLAARQRKWQPGASVRGRREEEPSKPNSINAHLLEAPRPVSLPVSCPGLLLLLLLFCFAAYILGASVQ